MAELRRLSLATTGDILLAALFTTVAELDVWVRETVHGPRPTNAVLLAFVAPPLAIRRRWPSVAVAVTGTAIAVQAFVVGDPPSGFLYAGPILIGAYSLGAHARVSRRSLAALALLVFGYGVVTVYYTGNQGLKATDVSWFAAALVPWGAGHFVGRRRAAAAAVADAERAERSSEQERLAALEQERGRMARELHDILAHSVSLMGVQAGAAEEVLARDPERARPVLRSIQQTSRDSVGELRRLLGMLRADELEADRSPQPGIEQLGLLVERMRDAGLPVELSVEGRRRALPAGLALTAYRVVQESLTNALKHAHPSLVEIVVRYEQAQLELRVVNDGVVANGRTVESGHGLIGMRERVSLYGGRLEARPEPGGRFLVEAGIPFDAADA